MSMQKNLLHAVLALSTSHKVTELFSVTDIRVVGELAYREITLQEIGMMRLGLSPYRVQLAIWLHKSNSLRFSLESISVDQLTSRNI